MLFINVYKVIFATAEADFLRPFDGVEAVLLVDAAEEVGGVVGGSHLLLWQKYEKIRNPKPSP